MKFQSQWEEEHKKREWGKYPSESVIRFVARNFYSVKDRKQVRILDAGCGIGANAWYLIREGFDAYGFDGSESAIAKLKKRLAEEGIDRKCLEQFVAQDALDMNYPDNFFDAVIDVAMIPCFDDESMIQVLKTYRRILRAGGVLYCYGLHEVGGVYGLESGVRPQQQEGKNDYMIGEIKSGRLKGEYYHNFFDRDRLQVLFKAAGFSKIRVDYFTEDYEDKSLNYKYYNVTAFQVEERDDF